MAERYQLQIGERATPGTFGRAYGAGGTGAQVGSALAGVGQAAQKWGAYLQEYQAEWDAASVMNAQNEYARRMADRLDNPETGWTVTRKLGAARGLTGETWDYAEQTAREIEAQLENENQKAAFRNIAERAKLTYWKQASVHEAREIRTYQDQAFQTSVASANELVTKAPADEFAVRTAREQVENAIRAQYYGSDEKFIQQTIEQAYSDMDARRITLIAQDDPVGALAMLEQDDGLALTPEAKAELKARIQPKAEVYEVQGIVDGLVSEFPQGKERDGLIEIRKRYNGPMQDKIASAYKTRMNELDIDENQERRLKALQQEANFEELYKVLAQGGTVSKELLDDWYFSGKISMQRHEYGVRNWIEQTANRARIEARLLSDNPDMTQEELDAGVMRQMGVTDEEHKRIFAQAAKLAALGRLKEYELDAAHKAGKLTTEEAEKLKGQMKAWDKSQSAHYSRELSDLRRKIKELVKDAGLPEDMTDGMLDEFITQAAELDTRSATYRQELFDLKQRVLLDGIEGSGKDLDGMVWGRSKLGKRYDAFKDAEFTDKGVDPYPMLPEVEPSEVDLPSEAAEAAWTQGAEFKNVIDDCAKTHGVDPALVRAIIKVESNWNTKAVSSAGAQGLMQLMPKTAAGLGVTDSFDPEQNIRGGTKYIADLLTRYNGDVEKAVGAYNCGEGNMDKVIAGKRELPKQTAKYVPKVLALYRKYKGERKKARTEKPQAAPEKPAINTPFDEVLSGDVEI